MSAPPPKEQNQQENFNENTNTGSDELNVKKWLEELYAIQTDGRFTISLDDWQQLLQKAKQSGLQEELRAFITNSFDRFFNQWKQLSGQGSLDVDQVKNYMVAARSVNAEIGYNNLEALLSNDNESLPNQQDEAVVEIEKDQLGRAAFARYLVKRIEATPIGTGAYSIHLSGPWGSGKTTVMNFIYAELKKENEAITGRNKKINKRGGKEKTWNVIKFNAWQNQHQNPPWWTIYSQIFTQTREQLGLLFRLREYVWRSISGQPFFLIIFLITFWVLAFVFNYLNNGQNPNNWATMADNISKILALVATIATGVVGFTRSLFSAKAAQNFEQHTSDPMKTIRTRFKNLVDKLNKKSRQLVFIDDLDRCNEKYVVSLLEGIQTLFRQGGLVFVVAADKNWLNNCFEMVYALFAKSVREPGKTLGALFLEKTFQLSASMPAIPPEFKKNYWQQLIEVKDEEVHTKINEARAKAKNRMTGEISNENINRVIDGSKGENMLDQIALREEAVLKLATPESLERTEHILKPYITLLDDNPRSMKRFVNAFSLNNTQSILSFLDIDKNVLALWTIINMRWPVLAKKLADDPETIDKINLLNIQDLDPEIQKLVQEEEVISVLNGGGIAVQLSLHDIKSCSALQ